MPYTNNIPMATDFLSISQPQIQANFMAIATAFNLNHVAFKSANPLQGKPAFVEMPNQSTAPATPPTTIAGETGLYCSSSTLTSQPELFFIKQSGTTAPAPLNVANGYEISSSNYIANPGWTRLPSGILIMWGFASVPNNTTPVTLTISATIPNFFNIYQIFLTSTSTISNIPQNVSLRAITQPTNAPGPVAAGAFTVNASSFGGSGVGFNYLVIGV